MYSIKDTYYESFMTVFNINEHLDGYRDNLIYSDLI